MPTTLELALVLVSLALLTGWWWRHRQSSGRAAPPKGTPSERIDTIAGWPAQATRVLTSQERLAFHTLTRALPEHMVLAQVPMSRFLSVSKRNSYADWLRRVGYQCVDFAVCDAAAQVIAVIELQAESGPPSERAKKRLTRMARALQATDIPLLIWRADALPSVAAARAAVLPKGAPMAAAFNAPPPRPASLVPVPEFNPFEDAGRDSTQDERIELLEPPPSTWFDEFDSELAPLGKH